VTELELVGVLHLLRSDLLPTQGTSVIFGTDLGTAALGPEEEDSQKRIKAFREFVKDLEQAGLILNPPPPPPPPPPQPIIAPSRESSPGKSAASGQGRPICDKCGQLLPGDE
jgi:hypothetical protein